MKVGIITFHWATNYGAVLQAYALQEALKGIGMEVHIINYKPNHFDDSIWTFIRYRKFLRFNKFLENRNKENKLKQFRNRFLTTTNRYHSLNELREKCSDLDVLITGSDQVLNPSFLQYGERGGSTAYFLDFGKDQTIRMSYAASFGTVDYPANLIPKVSDLVKRFNFISSRENSGCDIFRKMGGKDPVIVPDPTLLHSSDFYESLLKGFDYLEDKPRAYILHNRENHILKGSGFNNITCISDESLEVWLNKIRSSSHLITNSFHGTVFAILFKVPFTVVLPTKENIGMNDRFYTLLTPIELTDHIVSEAEFSENSLIKEFDWGKIQESLDSLKLTGINFLKQITSHSQS